jgi:outer membrane receptor protein involved in Fe transport
MTVLVLAHPAAAQTTTATLRGRAADQQGAILPGVTVTARNVETNLTRSVVTGELGQYFLPNLPAGPYDLTASLQGFVTERREALELRVGQEITIDFVLRVGGVQEAVSVVGETPLLETTRTTLGSIIKKEQIDDLPTVERDFSALAKLAPGVSTGVGGNGEGLAINGQRSFANGFFVDGATAEWQYYGKQSSTFVQDWIQEFQVLTQSYAAEFGTASGGILNVITRSGTNNFQGRFYGFFRDAKFDSAPFAGFFENGEPQYLDEAAPFSQQRIGGFLGGPVLRDKLFFFVGLENLNKDSSEILGVSDFWRARDVRTVLEGGTNDHPYLVKGDVNVNANNRLSVRYDRSVRKDLNQSQFGTPLDTEEDRYTFGGPIWNIVGNWTTTLSNTSFNEARVFFGSNKAPIICNKSGTGGSEELEKARPGTYAHIEYPGALFGCPIFDGLEGEENIVLTDNFSVVRGRHQFKLGAQVQQVRTIVDAINFHNGFWSHPSDSVFDRNNPATFPDLWIGNIGQVRAQTNLWNQYLYAQDTWQLTDDLTLNLGLRYDIDRSATAGNEFVDAKNARIVQRYGGEPLLEKTKIDYNNFAPRLGFVWTPTADHKTTIRGSGGLFYDQNHNNFNAIYMVNTLLSDGFIVFDANDPFANPFFDPADEAGSAARLRAFLAANYPFFPDLSLAPVSKEAIDRVDPNLKIPYTAQISAGLSREIGTRMTVDVDYVHSRGEDAPVGVNDNVALVNGNFVARDDRFSGIFTFKNLGTSRYNALQTQMQYRSAKGQLGVSYTLSKTTSNNAGTIFGGSATNPFDLSEDEGADSADRRHNFVFNGSYLLPLDFHIAGIAFLGSARPFTVTTRFQLDEDPFRDRPEPRNSRRGDSEQRVDLRVGKTFRVSRVTVTGFWEMFNAFNTDNFVNFAGSLQSPDFGRPLGALDKRRQQVGFRIDF